MHASLAKGFDGFETGSVALDEVSVGYRIGGDGPPVLLLHGWPQTGYEWRHVAADLVQDHRVIVPDSRGVGSSTVPASGYDKRSLAADQAGLLNALGIDAARVVGHDIGMMVATALAIDNPEYVHSLALAEATLPGTAGERAFVATGGAWHFGFNAHVELALDLTRGRHGRYFDRFYDELTADPSSVGAEERSYYEACYAPEERLRASYEVYRAFESDAPFFKEGLAGGVDRPTLVLAGATSLGSVDGLASTIAADLGTDLVVTVPNAGHFIPEENPEALISELRRFWSEV